MSFPLATNTLTLLTLADLLHLQALLHIINQRQVIALAAYLLWDLQLGQWFLPATNIPMLAIQMDQQRLRLPQALTGQLRVTALVVYLPSEIL